jgi:hypothetical protein
MGALRDDKRASWPVYEPNGTRNIGVSWPWWGGPIEVGTLDQTAIRNGRMRCDGQREQTFIVAVG